MIGGIEAAAATGLQARRVLEMGKVGVGSGCQQQEKKQRIDCCTL
jgi:hypothetical protein